MLVPPRLVGWTDYHYEDGGQVLVAKTPTMGFVHEERFRVLYLSDNDYKLWDETPRGVRAQVTWIVIARILLWVAPALFLGALVGYFGGLLFGIFIAFVCLHSTAELIGNTVLKRNERLVELQIRRARQRILRANGWPQIDSDDVGFGPRDFKPYILLRKN